MLKRTKQKQKRSRGESEEISLMENAELVDRWRDQKEEKEEAGDPKEH